MLGIFHCYKHFWETPTALGPASQCNYVGVSGCLCYAQREAGKAAVGPKATDRLQCGYRKGCRLHICNQFRNIENYFV